MHTLSFRLFNLMQNWPNTHFSHCTYICADPWHAALLLPSFDRLEFVRILYCIVYCILAFREENEESCGSSQRRTSMEVHTTYKDSYWKDIFLSVWNELVSVQIKVHLPPVSNKIICQVSNSSIMSACDKLLAKMLTEINEEGEEELVNTNLSTNLPAVNQFNNFSYCQLRPFQVWSPSRLWEYKLLTFPPWWSLIFTPFLPNGKHENPQFPLHFNPCRPLQRNWSKFLFKPTQ